MATAKRKHKTAARIIAGAIVFVAIIAIMVAVSYGHPMPVLDTHGVIANKERDLIYLTVLLSLIVVVPVFAMLIVIGWKYRASNKKATYQPNYGGNKVIEAFWWGIPCAIILALAIITAYATHDLDPYKPIASANKPMTIQVVALQWRWLFIYPDQHVATLNYVNIPENTPINFTITADAPMNSFWIPALAGQIYAMPGMSTQLHAMADGTGTYDGSSANISGSGFADMTFKVRSMSSGDFHTWMTGASQSTSLLDANMYAGLSKPNSDKTNTTFMLIDPTLYNDIIMKTMGDSSMNMMAMPGMSM
jgi:cytochrome o ubiquinol oxidase subunit 2